MACLLRHHPLSGGLASVPISGFRMSGRHFSSLGNAVQLSRNAMGASLLFRRHSPAAFLPGRVNLQVATISNRRVGAKQQMVGVRTKLKTHSGAKKRFSLTGSGLVKFKRAHKHHKMYHKSKQAKKRLLKYGYLKTGQARRVLTMMPYQLGRAKLKQKHALAKKLNRMEMESKLVRSALAEQHSPESFTKQTVGTMTALADEIVELPSSMQNLVSPTNSFSDPHARSYAGAEQIHLPIKTDPTSIEKMVLRGRAHQKLVDRALRQPGERRHRWRPLRTEGVVFPPAHTPPVEMARQRAQRAAFVQARELRESRTRQNMLKRHESKLLRDKMVAEHA